MIEAGVPDFVSVSFTGIVAPAQTPPDIVNKLNAAIGQALGKRQDPRGARSPCGAKPAAIAR